jgi:hypothetical protein
MNFQELSIAPISYSSELNPKLWDNNQLIPEVRVQLLKIARHFADFLNVKRLNLRDITISGSNAAYGYNDSSDLDLHLVADIATDEMAELYDAKKNVSDAKIDSATFQSPENKSMVLPSPATILLTASHRMLSNSTTDPTIYDDSGL